MDDKKDIQKSNPLLRFFDKHSVRTNPFGANQSADRAYRRAERLAAALFLVTNHIPEHESLKIEVRSKALQLLPAMLDLRDEMRAESKNIVVFRTLLRHLISLVRMLSVAGFLSIQNTNTVIEGLDELGNFIQTSQNSHLSETVILSQDILLDISEKPIKDNRHMKDMSDIKDTPIMSNTMSDRKGTSVREENIITVLRTGGELGIRDIASHLPEYSEKMIQRHLVDLIERGRVKKTGLKRWSRYSLPV